MLKTHVRWMIRRDFPEVHAIDAASFDPPWGEEAMFAVLRQRNCIGMVAEKDERVVGFMVYELHREKIRLLTLCVHPEWRRRGVGRQLVYKLFAKLSEHRRTSIEVLANERSLGAQLFLKALAFSAYGVERGFYCDGSDAYLFAAHIEAVEALAECRRIGGVACWS